MATRLTILGSSAAVPANNRNLSAQLLEIEGYSLLFDCGEATQFQLKKYKLNLFKISHIFISHLHGDHFFGLPGLISTMNMMGRKNPLIIYSPKGLQQAINPLFNLSNMKLEFEVVFNVVDSTTKVKLFTNELFSVSAFPLVHSVEAYGYICNRHSDKLNIRRSFIEENPNIKKEWFPKIKSGEDYINEDGIVFNNADITRIPKKDISFAYCTDTAYCAAIAGYVSGVDLLYHESTYLDEDEDNAIMRKHSTARQAGEIANAAGVGKLLLGHFSGRYRDVSKFKSEAGEVFSKEIILAIEGMQIQI